MNVRNRIKLFCAVISNFSSLVGNPVMYLKNPNFLKFRNDRFVCREA